jgi:beta-glucanase (GH16 family)
MNRITRTALVLTLLALWPVEAAWSPTRTITSAHSPSLDMTTSKEATGPSSKRCRLGVGPKRRICPDTAIDDVVTGNGQVTATFHGKWTRPEGYATHEFECQLDGRQPERCTSPKTYNHVPPGEHTFNVTAIENGQRDPTRAKRTFRIAFPAQSLDAQPGGIPGPWNLRFHDEFEGAGLNLSNWNPNWFGGPNDVTQPTNGLEVACYRPSQSVVANGELRQTAVAWPNCVTKPSGRTFQIATGAVTTINKHEFIYGAFEARIWTTCKYGSWNSWWTAGMPPYPDNGEIDILESLASERSEFHYHHLKNGVHTAPGGSVIVPGACAGWHTYAIEWEPGRLRWFYDGQQVWEQTHGVVSVPHYLVLALAINRTGADLPMTMRTDYIRVWQRP